MRVHGQARRHTGLIEHSAHVAQVDSFFKVGGAVCDCKLWIADVQAFTFGAEPWWFDPPLHSRQRSCVVRKLVPQILGEGIVNDELPCVLVFDNISAIKH
jgi:hypothetical protein